MSAETATPMTLRLGHEPSKPTGRQPSRRSPRRPSSADQVRLPPPNSVVDWSPPTLALLGQLTPLEQGLVQWMAAGCSAAEAYRRTTGNDSMSARQSAYQVRSRPAVRAALAAALADRNLGARLDREA